MNRNVASYRDLSLQLANGVPIDTPILMAVPNLKPFHCFSNGKTPHPYVARSHAFDYSCAWVRVHARARVCVCVCVGGGIVFCHVPACSFLPNMIDGIHMPTPTPTHPHTRECTHTNAPTPTPTQMHPPTTANPQTPGLCIRAHTPTRPALSDHSSRILSHARRVCAWRAILSRSLHGSFQGSDLHSHACAVAYCGMTMRADILNTSDQPRSCTRCHLND